MRNLKTLSLLAILLVFSVVSTQAKDKQGKYFVSSKNVAIEGYDVVGYFNQNLALRGSKEHAVKYNGATYFFASEENRQAFQADPEKYLPQYGGWCAFAIAAKKMKVAPDPKTFKLVDGKLYLFYNGEMMNTIIPWNANEQNLKIKADQNWAKIGN